jgi:CubicO group peptidase (beta-lactamase class C family)
MIDVIVPEKVGISSERLARLDAVLSAAVKDNRLPGILTLVQRRGEIVQQGCYGMMDIEAGKPMQQDALFRIYSMTKPIASVALMMLFEEGHFNLEAPVAQYIPAFAKIKVYEASTSLGPRLVEQATPMNIRQLLTHTSGLSYGFFFDHPMEDMYRQFAAANFKRHQTLQASVEALAELPLLFQPGTQWRYSMATDVVGYLIEVLSGMPFADFLQERIFKPLGMEDTAFQVEQSKVPRLAQIYTTQTMQNSIPIPPAEVGLIGDVTLPTQGPSGGGGLVSTLADYLKFANCLLNKGAYDGGCILGSKTVEWMASNHVPAALFPLMLGPGNIGTGFGLGFGVTLDIGAVRYLSSVGEFGWGGAAQTHFLVDPKEELITLFMTQMLPDGVIYPFRERYQNLVYQALVD